MVAGLGGSGPGGGLVELVGDGGGGLVGEPPGGAVCWGDAGVTIYSEQPLGSYLNIAQFAHHLSQSLVNG